MSLGNNDLANRDNRKDSTKTATFLEGAVSAASNHTGNV